MFHALPRRRLNQLPNAHQPDLQTKALTNLSARELPPKRRCKAIELEMRVNQMS